MTKSTNKKKEKLLKEHKAIIAESRQAIKRGDFITWEQFLLETQGYVTSCTYKGKIKFVYG